MNSTKQKVVITGGTGLLGSTAPIVMRDKWDIELWTRSHMASFKDIEAHKVDLESYEDVLAALKKSDASVVIHTAGLTGVEECERNQYAAHLSNGLTTRNLARASKSLNIKMIYISTDQVLTDKKNSLEDEIAFPINVYAKTKLEGEFETVKNNKNSLVLRVNFFTWGSKHRKSFLDFIVDNLRQSKTITLFDDVRFSPLSAEQILLSIDLLIKKDSIGIFNLVGNDSLTKHEFGVKVAKIFNLNEIFIKKGKISSQHDLVERPKDLTLSNSKIQRELADHQFPSLDEVLISLKSNEDHFKNELFSSITTPQSKAMIQYGKQSIDDSDFESVLSCLNSALLTQGPKIEEFERKIASYVGSKYAVAMCNWTAGLHMSMLAAGVGPGDNVITSPLSFVASSNCALYVGANPHFVDINSETLNIDVNKLEQKCRELKNVKAIIPVHFAGAPCDMVEIARIAKKYGAVVIEDAAHALGGSYSCGEKVGNPKYSSMVGFSFHPVKNITTGEGGLVTTNDERIYRKLLKIRSHGINKVNDSFINTEMAFTNGQKNQWYYEMQEIGFNFRITDIQCSLGLSQMRRVDHFHQGRVKIAQSYDEAFCNLKNLKLLQPETRTSSGNHLYVARINFKQLGLSRYELFEQFKTLGIYLHVHYIPITKQPFYSEIVFDDFPNVDDYYEHAITIPLFSSMSNHQIDTIIQAVKEIIG